MILLYYKRILIKLFSDYIVFYNEKEIVSFYEYLFLEIRILFVLLVRVFTMALWLDRFWTKFLLGNFYCLMLLGEAEVNVYL